MICTAIPVFLFLLPRNSDSFAVCPAPFPIEETYIINVSHVGSTTYAFQDYVFVGRNLVPGGFSGGFQVLPFILVQGTGGQLLLVSMAVIFCMSSGSKSGSCVTGQLPELIIVRVDMGRVLNTSFLCTALVLQVAKLTP